MNYEKSYKFFLKSTLKGEIEKNGLSDLMDYIESNRDLPVLLQMFQMNRVEQNDITYLEISAPDWILKSAEQNDIDFMHSYKQGIVKNVLAFNNINLMNNETVIDVEAMAENIYRGVHEFSVVSQTWNFDLTKPKFSNFDKNWYFYRLFYSSRLAD